jgi:hypothetical protein
VPKPAVPPLNPVVFARKTRDFKPQQVGQHSSKIICQPTANARIPRNRQKSRRVRNTRTRASRSCAR